MQGSIVSKELLDKKYNVLLCDKNDYHKDNLPEKYRDNPFEIFDLEDTKKTVEVIKNSGANIVVNCAEDDYNLNVLKACIEVGVHNIDLGSYFEMTKQQLEMDTLLKEKNLIHITGCGSAPGIVNVMLKYASKQFDKITNIEAGFVWDSNIKKFVVPFSMQGILYEFTKPAYILENGEFIQKNPLENTTKRHFRVIGTQKIMLINHAEPYTFYHYFKDKGLQNVRFYGGFPTHSFEKIMALIEMGLDSEEKIMVDGKKVKPIDILVEALRRLKKPEGYQEHENLWVDIYGEKDRQIQIVKMECIAPTIYGWEEAGCNIDTGFPAAIIARMVKEEVIKTPGSYSPEGIVPEKQFFAELRKKGMIVYENGKAII